MSRTTTGRSSPHGLPVSGLRRRPRRAHATADDVGTDYKEPIRIDRTTWPDHGGPPTGFLRQGMGAGDMLIAGEGMTNQDCVDRSAFNSP